MSMKTNVNASIREPERSTPIRAQYDVLVVGGGPAGLMSALAASGDGLKVGLVENRSFLGGNLTIGLPVLGFLGQKGNQIIKGLAQKFIDRLKARGAAGEHRPCPLHMGITLVEPEAVKAVALDMLAEAGVDLMLYTLCAEVLVNGREVCGIITESKNGREAVLGRVVIDCTGDGDVAYRAGVPCGKGDANGGMQPPTLMFCVAGVDTDMLRQSIANQPAEFGVDYIPPEYFAKNDRFIVVGLRNLLQKARDEKGLSIANERTIIITGLRPGEVWINMTRVKGIDGTDTRSLTVGEAQTRAQIDDIVTYLKSYVPGFENSYYAKAAPFLGIRETRRIVGHYILTQDDVLGCRKFDDAIAVASYPIDIHRPGDNDCTLVWCGDCYDIPYRCLVPLQLENLLVAGRCISTTHEAMGAIRVMSTCMAMGEAAGRAARIAVKHGVAPSAIDVQELRKELLANGAYLRT